MRYFIITGASKGLGGSLARKAIGPDSHVFCISRQENTELQELARQESGRLDYFAFDLSDTDRIPDLMEAIFGFVNKADAGEVCLINNAGILAPIKPIGEAEAEEIELNIKTNLLAPLILTSQFLKYSKDLRAEKKIINISSKASRTPRINWLCYGSSKSGIDNLTYSVALEQKQAKHPAKIIAFYPGVMDTDMRKENAKAGSFYARLYVLIRNFMSPLKSRIEHPDHVADYLMSYIKRPDFGRELFVDFEGVAPPSSADERTPKQTRGTVNRRWAVIFPPKFFAAAVRLLSGDLGERGLTNRGQCRTTEGGGEIRISP